MDNYNNIRLAVRRVLDEELYHSELELESWRCREITIRIMDEIEKVLQW